MNIVHLFVLFTGIKASRILVLNIVPSYNHYNLLFRLVEELTKRGHEITFVSPYPYYKVGSNIETIFVDRLYDFVEEKFEEGITEIEAGLVQKAILEFQFGLKYTEAFLQDDNVQKLLQSDKKFDLVLMEHFFNEPLVGIAHHFNAPVVFLSSVRSGYRSNFLFANPEPLHYIPNLYGTLNENIDFWQRLHGFFGTMSINFIREVFYMPRQRRIFKKYFHTNTDLDGLMYNVSLMLCNSHAVINTALPQVPNLIDIGGYHIRPPTKLPQDLQTYLDEATEGVVLFSLGSGIKSKSLMPQMKRSILNALARIKQKVIWKFEGNLTNVSENVNIVRWLPQQDILAHRNVRAFITQGGASSLIETVYFGVPIVGVPVFSDQQSNIGEAEINGYAVKVSLTHLTEDILYQALQEVIYNPKYKQNVQKLSKLIRDQPSKPIETAMFWIERVIEYNGDLHLQSAELSLRWYQRMKIDIFAFIVISVVTIVIAIGLTLKALSFKTKKSGEAMKKCKKYQ